MAKPPKKIPRTLPLDSHATSVEHPNNPLGANTGESVHPAPGTANVPALAESSSPNALPAAPEPRSTVTTHPLPPESSQRPSVIVHHFPVGSTLANAAEWVALHFSENQQAAVASTSTRERAQHPVFINAQSASRLKLQPDTEEGFRYDKRKKAYVEMPGGMVMVGRAPDGWRQTHAGESTPTGERVEQIPGTKLWRETDVSQPRHQALTDPVSTETTEPVPGPSRPPRLDEHTHVATDTRALVEHLFSQQSVALDLSAGQWRNWGKAKKPDSGESIEIDGQHFQIVAQGVRADTGLVYLQHPGSSLDSFDAFENMLRHEPSRQPKWALKRHGQWKVLDNHAPFEMSANEYVSTAYNYLSAQSTSNLARAVFDRVSLPQGLNAYGLSVMARTFRHWVDRVNNEPPIHSLSDPLVMLPKLPTTPGNLPSGGLLTLPAHNSAVLQRLDFDPQRFPLEWAPYAAAPTPGNLRALLVNVLQHNGYSVNPTTRRLSEGALIFHRPRVAAIFVLKLPHIAENQVLRTTPAGSELTDPTFLTRLSAEQKQKLDSHLVHNEVIHLVGGIQHVSPDNPTLFIVREG
ncbi:hypothetical protein [Pseudomonas fluorescens]|uniref:Uncharacterized protein n=1 Tax=Pseudomonas fluorescens TaxID=294 RepID=A0A5E6QTI5_PSEFL|nr:hypothetical protein [Pseudomonas fluorescens]VVM56322.1 hypothetical protein PS655_01047 [Pseudomonas fluorescens]